MKTNISHLKSLVSAVLVLGSGVIAIPTAFAGPGPAYWSNRGETTNTTTVSPLTPVSPSTRACTDSRVATVTKVESTMPNGRSGMRSVEVGKKLVCSSCDAPIMVMKPSGHNGRGAMTQVAVKGTHDCTKGCTVVASAD